MVRIVTDSSYDEVPYEGGLIPGAHPDRLATIARLFGVEAADPADCSLLEIGCAGGANLLPMAYCLPNSRFVGIDPSQRQIDMARQVFAEYGVTNTELLAADVREIVDWDRKFDFIICHGVFSWVPDDVQDAILEACKRLLAPNGVAYISYNTLPGFYARLGIREMLRFHASHFSTPTERAEQARGLLAFLGEATSSLTGAVLRAHHQQIEDERELLDGMPDSYLIHEHMSEHNQAFYFHEFVDLAGEHDLQYLGDAVFPSMMLNDLPPEVAEQISAISSSQLALEQYRDFVVNRMFRKTLICHEALPLRRQISTEVLARMQYRRRIAKNDEGEWVIPRTLGNSVKVSDPSVKAVLEALERAVPRSLSFDELVTESGKVLGAPITADGLAAVVLSLFALDAIDVRVWTPRMASTIAERPEVFAPARKIPAGRRTVVPLPQHAFAKPTPFVAAMLHLVDGTRTAAEIVDAIEDEIARELFVVAGVEQADLPPRAELETMVPEALEQLRQVGILSPA